MAIFCSGTSNIELVEKNKKAFPPEFQSKSRLTYYSSLFNSVEINSTFYKLPLPATLEKWAAEVPEGFRFTLKLWREITHAGNFAFTKEQVTRFMGIADHIGRKKGALLVQLPAGIGGVHIGQLEILLKELQKFNPDAWQIAVELRHKSWYTQQVYSLLDSFGAALVWHDKPFLDEDKFYERGPFIYLRFHGPNGDYKGSYPDAQLREQAGHIRSWLAEGKNVYAYFNNTMEGDAPRNLITLNNRVASAGSIR
jgi:uncharacterized protein YecE (DUF72 family)